MSARDAASMADLLDDADHITDEMVEQHAAIMEDLATIGAAQPLYVFANTFFEDMTRQALHVETGEALQELNSCGRSYHEQLERAAENDLIDEATYEVLDHVRDTRNDALNNEDDPDIETLNEALGLYEEALDDMGYDVDVQVTEVHASGKDEIVETLQDEELYAAAFVEAYDRSVEGQIEAVEEKGCDVLHDRVSYTGGGEVDDLAVATEMKYLKKEFGHRLHAFEPDRYRQLVDERQVEAFQRYVENT